MFTYVKAAKKTVELTSSPHPRWGGQGVVSLNYNKQMKIQPGIALTFLTLSKAADRMGKRYWDPLEEGV